MRVALNAKPVPDFQGEMHSTFPFLFSQDSLRHVLHDPKWHSDEFSATLQPAPLIFDPMTDAVRTDIAHYFDKTTSNSGHNNTS